MTREQKLAFVKAQLEKLDAKRNAKATGPSLFIKPRKRDLSNLNRVPFQKERNKQERSTRKTGRTIDGYVQVTYFA